MPGCKLQDFLDCIRRDFSAIEACTDFSVEDKRWLKLFLLCNVLFSRGPQERGPTMLQRNRACAGFSVEFGAMRRCSMPVGHQGQCDLVFGTLGKKG